MVARLSATTMKPRILSKLMSSSTLLWVASLLPVLRDRPRREASMRSAMITLVNIPSVSRSAREEETLMMRSRPMTRVSRLISVPRLQFYLKRDQNLEKVTPSLLLPLAQLNLCSKDLIKIKFVLMMKSQQVLRSSSQLPLYKRMRMVSQTRINPRVMVKAKVQERKMKMWRIATIKQMSLAIMTAH